MKIEFEIENKEDFLKALNHVLVTYNHTVFKNIFLGLTDNLPGPLYKKWVEEEKLSCDEMEEIVKTDLKVIKNIYEELGKK